MSQDRQQQQPSTSPKIVRKARKKNLPLINEAKSGLPKSAKTIQLPDAIRSELLSLNARQQELESQKSALLRGFLLGSDQPAAYFFVAQDFQSITTMSEEDFKSFMKSQKQQV